MYIEHYSGFIIKKISNTETVSFPIDEKNELYKEYLIWISEGNDPEIFLSPEDAILQQNKED
jgi:hypothetical protein